MTEQDIKDAITSLATDLTVAIDFDPILNGQVADLIVKQIALEVQSLINFNRDVEDPT